MSKLAQLIVTKSVTLNSVAVQMLDDDVRLVFETDGPLIAVERATENFLKGRDRFYRTILSAGAVMGIYHLVPSVDGDYDQSHTIVKSLLSHVSEKTSSARSYASQIMRCAWVATQKGLDPFQFGNIADLRSAGRPIKEVSSDAEQALASTTARQAKADADAKADATAKADADATAKAKADADATAKAKADADATIKSLRAEIAELRIKLAKADATAKAKADADATAKAKADAKRKHSA